MLNLTQRNFKRLKDLLLRQKQEVEEEIKALDEDDTVMVESPAESVEPGTESWMADVHTRATAAKQSLQQLLSKISKSLSAINSGKYGKCEKCGMQIEEKRLLAMPTATLCISCSKKSVNKK